MRFKQRIKENIIAAYIIGALLLLLISARLYLPYYVKDYVNHTLQNINGHTGSVQDIDINLWRGAYVIQGLTIKKLDNNVSAPFVDINNIDLSIEWSALLKGRIVSDIYLTDAVIRFIVNDGNALQTGENVDWTVPIKELSPIDINFIKVDGGKISYIDYVTSPDIEMHVDQLQGKVTNLSNVVDKNVALPSDITFTGKSTGNGNLSVEGKINILKKDPNYNINVKLESADLTAFNRFANHTAAIDFHDGLIAIYSEIAVKDHKLSGYIKPILTDIDVVSIQQDNNPLNLLWESFASILIELFENQSQEQFATKVPVNGNLNNIQTNSLAAIGAIFENAFIQAFKRDVDNSVKLSDVESTE